MAVSGLSIGAVGAGARRVRAREAARRSPRRSPRRPAAAADPAVHQVKAVAKAAPLVESLGPGVDRIDADHVLVETALGKTGLDGVEQCGPQAAAALLGAPHRGSVSSA